ncbi:MAG: hypothetical protein JXQ74_02520 [Alphaproteobacteria bacterium]|nr:hypothetical protein [Alphaproteobacteria bacterium]
MRYFILILPLIMVTGCSCFRSCHCTPEIEENEKLIVPPELQTNKSILLERRNSKK